MIRAIKQTEGVPVDYPAVEGVEGAALAAAWQRVEHFIAWRYSPREVVWRVSSCAGEWSPPLAPIVSITAQQGSEPAYVPETGPMGGYVLRDGDTVLTATVGAGPAPAVVLEAVRRLAAYNVTADQIPAGVTRFSSGSFNASVRREDIAPARAMVNSGAADLLRAYRRV